MDIQSIKKGHSLLILKELHLTPLYIYMINESEGDSLTTYVLEMEKGTYIEIKMVRQSELQDN